MKKQKTIFFCCGFAECNDHCTRQSWENSSNNFPGHCTRQRKLKKIKNALLSDLAVALGKENKKKIKTGFVECLGAMTLGKENSLPSVALGK